MIHTVHELSIALRLVEMASEHAGRLEGRVDALHVRVGRLSGVVTEALEFSFAVARAGTPVGEARLIVEDVPVALRCPACGTEGHADLVEGLRCAACGAPADVVAGRELELVALEVSDDVAADR